MEQAHKAGKNIGTVGDVIHQSQGEAGLRRIMGLLALAKKYGCAATEQTYAAALELRRPNTVSFAGILNAARRRHWVDPLIRELTQYRDLIQQRINFEETNHEPDRT